MSTRYNQHFKNIMSNNLIVLPRPGTALPDTRHPIRAPSEVNFTAVFGKILPEASYLSTKHGRVAFYELLPSSLSPPDDETAISRVLLLHGVQTPAIGLQPLASALSARFPHAKCVLIDWWGHGLTDTPFAAHNGALFHDLLESLFLHLGWGNAHLIGYSFGASIAASFAAARPERVASMVLVAPAGFIRSELFTKQQKSYLRGGEGLEEPAKEWILEFLEGGQLIVPQDWKESVGRGEVVAEAVRAWEMKNHEGHAASVVAIFRDGGVLDNSAEFAKAAENRIKYLYILGELDDVCSPQDLFGIGVQDFVIISQVGHAVVRDKASEVAQSIADFWGKI
ncbi:Alpha/Beta hydrolase protein [Trichoderma austrokoningii]